jgi:hypothetical protein
LKLLCSTTWLTVFAEQKAKLKTIPRKNAKKSKRKIKQPKRYMKNLLPKRRQHKQAFEYLQDAIYKACAPMVILRPAISRKETKRLNGELICFLQSHKKLNRQFVAKKADACS